MDGLPATIAECDAAIDEERKLLAAMLSPLSKMPIWDRIDTLLDRRVALAQRQRLPLRGVTSRRSTIPGIKRST